MKKYCAQIFFLALLSVQARGDTVLNIGKVAPFYLGGGGPCWTSGLIGPSWPSFSSSNAFTLTDDRSQV